MKTYNFVYKTTFSDGRYYIGQHKTDILNDNYFGSSIIVKNIIKQGNKPNREILRYCDTQKELNYWEKFYIGDNWKNDSLCLNESNVCGIREKNARYGKHHTDESKKKMSEALKGKYIGENNPIYGKTLSDEHRMKISKSLKGENHPMYGKTLSDEHRKKISESNKGRKTWNKGKPLSEETKKKLSESLKGKPTWNKGNHHSDEHRKKISEANKGKPCPTKGKHKVWNDETHTSFHYE